MNPAPVQRSTHQHRDRGACMADGCGHPFADPRPPANDVPRWRWRSPASRVPPHVIAPAIAATLVCLYYTEESDPDTFARAYGPRCLCLVAGIAYAPEPVPEEAPEARAAAEAWLTRSDAARLASLRKRWPIGGGGNGPRDLAALEDGEKEREARRMSARAFGVALRQRARDLRWLAEHPAEERRERMPTDERASRYLARLPPSISGSGGHDALWQAVLAVHVGFDLPEDVALRMLESEFNPRCQPPWTRRDIITKIKSARRASRPRGFLLHAGR